MRLPMGIRTESSPIIYREGGSFCKGCRIKYNFSETLQLLEAAIGRGTTGPRCKCCNKLVTTGRQSKSGHTFWELIKQRGKTR